MRHHCVSKSLIGLTMAGVLVSVTNIAFASAFQLWEQGEADLGDYHAGAAAIADNATTGFYNPAGLVRLNHQEITAGAALIHTDIHFRGHTTVNTINLADTYSSVQGGGTHYIPNIHYALPLNDRFTFGFGVTVPLGLSTDYGNSSPLRYIATRTIVQAVDISPSLGFALTKKFSVGAGFDAQRLNAEFDEYAGSTVTALDTSLTNRLYNWGYGWHGGVLYQFTPRIRVGLNYHSLIVHHASGSSVFEGPLADITTAASKEWRSDRLQANLIMPATTTLSFYQELNDQLTWMATANYTQWGAFNNLRLQNVAARVGNTLVNNLTIDVIQHFRNTWDFALGGIYAFSPVWQFKAGLGYDQTPVTTRYRTVQCPDNDRYVTAVGIHFQPSKAIGWDLGYAHFFLRHAGINNTIQVAQEIATANGNVYSNADVIGLQVDYKFL